jgi:hypothetical protein
MKEKVTVIITALLFVSMLSLAFNIQRSRAGTIMTPTSEIITASVFIDYANGTQALYGNVILLHGSSVLNATLAIARVNYTSLGEPGVFVDAINNVWNYPPHYWIWWYWNPEKSMWMLGPVASNEYMLNNGDVVAWYYENTETWPLQQPPWTPTVPVITATVIIHPQALNLKSKGQWITAYIELPKGYKAKDVEFSTVMLNGTVPAEIKPRALGTRHLIVKFDRAQVISYILSNMDIEERSMTATLTITGSLNDGTPFQGSDTTKIILPRNIVP